jgi:hypothetical protein
MRAVLIDEVLDPKRWMLGRIVRNKAFGRCAFKAAAEEVFGALEALVDIGVVEVRPKFDPEYGFTVCEYRRHP